MRRQRFREGRSGRSEAAGRWARRALAAAWMAAVAAAPVRLAAANPDPPPPPAAPPPVARRFDVAEYRIEGASVLGQAEIEDAVYPFLGPGRSVADVEAARAALEKAYADKGYQTVSVQIPVQKVRDGIVTLQVTEGKVGRLRVRGARWFSPRDVKHEAVSLAEGTVPNFGLVMKDVVALNGFPDRRVTPSVRSGAVPGTIDVDLVVQDSLPLHGSLEVNNRRSGNTSELRTSGSLRYDNLWQAGHSLSLSYQVAPQRPGDGQVLSGSYTARLPGRLSLLLYGVDQDSDISTVGGLDVGDLRVVGKGRIAGARLMLTLLGGDGPVQTVSGGIDYKRFKERVSLGSGGFSTPITYWPITAAYSAVWQAESSDTQLDGNLIFHLRGMGSGSREFEDKRLRATGSFVYFRGSLSRTQQLGLVELSAKAQGQVSRGPLVSSEQFSAGGLDTVRGYLESVAAGDDAALGSLEVRGPSFTRWFGKPVLDEWRLHAFAEGGWVKVIDPGAEQRARFTLWGVGGGSSFKALGRLNGSIDVGVPMTPEGGTRRFEPRFHFRMWTEF